MRDGFELPLVLKYDRRFYTEDSPWVFFTSGIKSNKGSDTVPAPASWRMEDISLMSRGIVCAYPLLRGTNYFDDDWVRSGIGERKLTHFMDMIDSAIFVKEKGLTKKLGIHGMGESGSITALNAIFREPRLFETAVIVNPITDLVQHLMEDIEDRQFSSSSFRELSVLEHDLRHYEKLTEFGDPQNKSFYELHKLISPYHIPIID